MGIHTLCYLTLYAVKGTTADKQYVSCVKMYILLVRVLASTLWWYVDDSALKQLEQSLLHTLSAYVACYAWVVALAGYLVNLVNKHDTSLSCLLVVVCHLQQTCKDALYVLAYIAGLGEHRGIDNGKRNVEQTGYGACE